MTANTDTRTVMKSLGTGRLTVTYLDGSRSKFGKSIKLKVFAQYAYPSGALVVDRIAWRSHT